MRQKFKLKVEYNELFTERSFIYFLGLFFADGYVHKSDSTMILTTTEDDCSYFENIFGKFCEYKTSTRKRKHYKPIFEMFFSNRIFRDFLWEIGYSNKKLNGKKIIEHIPSELRHLFFCGFFDGDGCIFFSKDKKQVLINFSGPHNQDWSFLENFLNENNISFRYRTVVVTKNNNKFSEIIISKQKCVYDFINIIYTSSDFGFKRKKNKCDDFINHFNYKTENSLKYKQEIKDRIKSSIDFFWKSDDGIKLKEKMRISNMGSKNPMYGKKMSESTINKRSEKVSKEYSLIGPNGNIYIGKNISKFAKDNSLDESCLMKVVNGKRKSHKGFLKYES